MELENLINKLKVDVKDVKEHLADYCYVEVNDIDAIIEYLEQLKEIGKIWKDECYGKVRLSRSTRAYQYIKCSLSLMLRDSR